MTTRFFSIVFLLFFCTSCQYFSPNKNIERYKMDTINLNSVDFFPTFPVCKHLIDKAKKETCFKNTIHSLLTKEIVNINFSELNLTNKTLMIHFKITSKNEVVFNKISGKNIEKNQILALENILKTCFKKLPKVFAATKQGIPVTTVHQIPIQITLE